MPRAPQLNFRSVPSPREIEWTRILERWKRSGLGGRAFCGREGLSEPQFYSWRRKLRLREEAGARRPRTRSAPPVRFVPVEVKPGPSAALELALSGGRVLRIPADFDAAALARLLPVLEARTAAEGEAC